ncbi:general secretion pathway protein GspH [Acidovorax sp. Root217]|nr:general secretion pathway protein GspH [Acidovorax sp. Root217]
MVVVAIVAILAALAGPSFRPLIERWRVRDAAESVISTFYFARSEAIKRGGQVIIQPNSNPGWGAGWHVFFDVSGEGAQVCDASKTPNECDLQIVPAPTKVDIGVAGTTNGAITIDRWGMASHTGGGSTAPTNMFFEIMPAGKDMTDSSAARVCVGMGGRIVRKKGSETC